MRWSLLAVLLIGASPIPAQEVPSPPAIDSILELVQSRSDHRGHDAVVLIEDSYFKLHADGRVTRTTRQVAQILTAAGAEEWGEYSFQYNSIRDRVRLDWMRVIEDGEVVQNGPPHQQTSKVSADQSSPVYSDMAVLQATLARVRPGAIVDYSFTVETMDPQQPGDFRGSWLLNGLFPVIRSRLVVDAPETMSIRVKDRAEGADHSEEVVGDRRLRTWTATDLDAIEVEPFAAMPSKAMMTVEVGPAVEWSDVGSWYHQFLPRQPVVSEALELAHGTVVADAATLRDSLSATYRWIAQDFRYVSLSLGDGGYRARSPHEVFETGFGDCKDKTMLFVALAEHMGVEAAPVLVHSEGEVDADLPSLTQFDHMIARVEHDGITSFVDLTAPVVPYGETPGNLEGSSGLVVALDGTTDFVTLPASEPSENTFSSLIEGTLDTENRFVGSVTYSATGSEQYWLRSQFYGIDEFDDRSREELVRGIAESVWESASVDSSRVFDGRDLDSPAAVTVWFTVTDVMGVAGERLLLNLPIPGYADPSLLATLEADDERRF
ncbi:MAG: DUF3857 domain-containing transglutaminase family protein, partial [Halobacteriales archaeon]|nr:DUF3857 domain-containing transglutaminase family protein [Halobacteriales archaeon]